MTRSLSLSRSLPPSATGQWSRLPARTRLTLWYVALLAGTLIVLGGIGQWLTLRSLYAGQDEVLRSKAAAVGTEVDMEKGRLEFPDDGPRNVMPSVASGLDVVRVWGADGMVVFDQGPGATFPDVAPATRDAVLAGPDHFETVSFGADTYRLYLQPVERKGKPVGVLEIGKSEAEIHAVITQLRSASVAGLVVALAVAWLGGSFLAGRALRPVDEITRAAEQMGVRDLSLRLPAPTVDDEFGRQTAAFNAMLERLERAFERQSRFTADASHELRTPLSTIRSLVDVALTSPRGEAYDRRVYASIAEETERLSRLIESLLVLARADQGNPLTLHPVDLDEIAVDAVERIAVRAAQQGVSLDLSASERCPVQGDATWLTQLLLNLLDNALRHTPPGGRIAVACANVESGPTETLGSIETPPANGAHGAGTALDSRQTRAVTLTVSDTGPGIAPEHLPRLFERFYRADAARARVTGGTGLGLAICAWIAQAHSGRLTVASELGRGTTFTLWLPGLGIDGDQPPRLVGMLTLHDLLGVASQKPDPDRP